MKPLAIEPRRCCGLPLETCLEKIERFHGFQAPGLVLGMFLVDRARSRIEEGVEYDAIVESRHCLPDAVQLFTPCTIGNGWMQILDWDKFALSFYDRRSHRGWRVWLDLRKARAYPDLYGWFMRTVPKKKLPLEVLLPVIIEAGPMVLSEMPVTITRYFSRVKKAAINVCPFCGEAFAAVQGNTCSACRGSGYYQSGFRDFGAAAGRR
jgi:formylmethanofuran dehydrogenase subunit E